MAVSVARRGVGVSGGDPPALQEGRAPQPLPRYPERLYDRGLSQPALLVAGRAGPARGKQDIRQMSEFVVGGQWFRLGDVEHRRELAAAQHFA